MRRFESCRPSAALIAALLMPDFTTETTASKKGKLQPEHRLLARPLDRRIAQSGDADAAWQSPFDGRFDEIGREECERDRHIDLAYAASLAFCDAFAAGLASSTSSLSQRRPRTISSSTSVNARGCMMSHCSSL
jgi:hypothetical protein